MRMMPRTPISDPDDRGRTTEDGRTRADEWTIGPSSGAREGVMSEEERLLCPLTGFRAARLPGHNVMVELQYVETLGQLQSGSPHILQLAMTMDRATGLAEAIRQAAAAPYVRPYSAFRSD